MAAVKLMSELTQAGFAKGCAVNKSFQVVGATAQDAVPQAWKSDDGTTINENQELQNDWAKSCDSGKFHFFGLKWNFVGQDQSDSLITLQRKVDDKSKLNGLICATRNDTWIMAAFKYIPPMSKEKAGKGVFRNFNAAQTAFEKCCEEDFEKED